MVVRDPYDVAVSFFRFFEGWFFEPGEVTLAEFLEEFWLARGVPPTPMSNASYWHHFKSWWEQRDQPNVLFLFYEDLKTDLASSVEKIAEFIRIEPNVRAERVRVATEKSSFEFMKAHATQFDEGLSKRHRNLAMGLPLGAGLAQTKVMQGQAGAGGAVLSEELKRKIDARWAEVLEQAVGAPSYAALRTRLQEAKTVPVNKPL